MSELSAALIGGLFGFGCILFTRTGDSQIIGSVIIFAIFFLIVHKMINYDSTQKSKKRLRGNKR